MKIKKILLGSVLISAVTATATVFSINISNERLLSQRDKTNSPINIYAQPVKVNDNKKTFRKVSKNISNVQMTPYASSHPKFKINFTGFKEPTSASSANGEAYFIIDHYSNSISNWHLQDQNGTGVSSHAGIRTSGNQVTITNLKEGDYFKLYFDLKSGYSWNDGTRDKIYSPVSTSITINYMNRISQPSALFRWIAPQVKQPTTKTSTDGEVIYTLNGFDSSKMDISLHPGSSGTLGAYNARNNTVKVSGLKNGQKAQISVGLKGDSVGAKKYMNNFGVDDDPTVRTNMHHSAQGNGLAEQSLSMSLGHARSLRYAFSLMQWRNGDPHPQLWKILSYAQYHRNITGFIHFDSALNEWSANGKSVMGKSHAFTWTVDSRNSRNMNSQVKLFMWVDSFNKWTGQLRLKIGTTLSVNGSGEDNGAVSGISFIPYKLAPHWIDKTTSRLNSPAFTLSQRYAGFQKTTFSKTIKEPNTSTSTDGEATYTLTNFNPNKMNISLAPGSNGTLGTYDSKTKTVKVTGVAVGQHTQIQVTPKTREAWTDGTKTVQKSSVFTTAQRYVGFKKTTFSKTTKEPTTSTSTDGEATFTLTNFDPNTMSVSLAHGSSGKLGTFSAATKKIKVTGVAVGQHAQIQITLKTNDLWTDGTRAPHKSSTFTPAQKYVGFKKTTFSKTTKEPTTKIASDGEATYTLTNFDPNKMDISLAPGSNGTLGTYDSKTKTVKVTGLAVGQHTQIQVTPKTNETWADGTKTAQKSSVFTAAQKYVGFKKTTFSKTTKEPTTKIASDGEATYTLMNFDPNKMDISLAPGSNGTLGTYDSKTKTVKVTGVAVGQHTQIQVTPKTREAWTDGTKTAQKSSVFTPAQGYVGFKKTTFSKTIKEPNTTTSTDGEATYTLTNFDPNKMDISLAPGSNGTLGTYDSKTKTVKVTGLAVGQHTQIQVTPKTREAWTDGTKTAQKSSVFTPKQTYVGVQKPTFSKIIKKHPTTTISSNGEATFILTNFDPKKMVISIAPGSSGKLGTYNPKTRTIKITDVEVGQKAQIQITLKTNDLWTDGTKITIPSKNSTITFPKWLLALIISLSTILSLILIIVLSLFYVYAKVFYYDKYAMQKHISLNLRLIKTFVCELGLKVFKFITRRK